jgi:hypothetical protein
MRTTFGVEPHLCILYSASRLSIIDIDAPALCLRLRSRRRSEMIWKGREGMKRSAPALLQPSPTARARRPHRPQSPRQPPRAKRLYLRTSTVYTPAPPRLTIDPGYCAPCPAASGLDRVAVAIPPRAALRLPLENRVSSGEGEEAEGRTYRARIE